MSRYTQLAQRVAVALVGIPVLLLPTWWGGQPFTLLVTLLILGVVFELAGMWRKGGVEANQAVPLLTALFFPQVIHLRGFDAPLLLSLLLISLILILLTELFSPQGDSFRASGAQLLQVFYGVLPFSLLVWFRDQDHGGGLVLLLLTATWAADVGAYFAGIRWGKHPLFPRVSPKKTVEGFLDGLTGALLLGWAFTPWLGGATGCTALVTAGIIGLLGPLGDLVESKFKRALSLKDSSSLLPVMVVCWTVSILIR